MDIDYLVPARKNRRQMRKMSANKSKKNSVKLNNPEQSSLAEEMEITNESILEELQSIRKELNAINEHKLLKVYNNLTKMMVFLLLRGILTGLGTVIGATVVASLVVFLLSRVELIPFIGSWLTQVIDAMDLQSLMNE